jgi:hypothetical protein
MTIIMRSATAMRASAVGTTLQRSLTSTSQRSLTSIFAQLNSKVRQVSIFEIGVLSFGSCFLLNVMFTSVSILVLLE